MNTTELNELMKAYYTPNGLAFYNGTACPITVDKELSFEKGAMELLRKFLVDGESLKSTGMIIKKQMDKLEQLLFKISKDKAPTKKQIKNWAKKCLIGDDVATWASKKDPELYVMSWWYTNIYILLKLKVIENDEMNGFSFYSVENNIEEEEENIAFECIICKKNVIKDSDDHNNSFTENGEDWICSSHDK